MNLRFVLASVLVPLLVVPAALAGGWWVSGQASDGRSSLTSALDTLPADTKIAGFTDWARIRDHLALGSASTAKARASLMNDAEQRDLSTRSAIGQSVEQMHTAYGWSAADLDWEAYGQAGDGAVMVARLGTSVSLATVRAGLRALGYTQDEGVWTAGEGTSATAGNELAATLSTIAIVPRGRLVIAVDRPAYTSTVLEVIHHDAPSLLSIRSAAGVAEQLTGSDSALLQDGALICSSSAVQDADTEAKAQARAAVTRAGRLVRPAFAGRSIDDVSPKSQLMRFAMSFGSPAQAARQLGVRTALASGPFIGRSGRVEDSLDLTRADVSSSTLGMRFVLDPDTATYMTGEGPLLFAGCTP